MIKKHVFDVFTKKDVYIDNDTLSTRFYVEFSQLGMVWMFSLDHVFDGF
jgi:hypothetical protein